MIDYFNSIFTAVAKELRKQVPGILVTSEIDDRPVKRFPCVQIEENNNLPVHIDSAGHSKYAAVSLRVRVYSNKNTGRIAEARSIVGIVDSALEPLKIYRKSFVPLNGLYNNSVYRIDCSYGATIGEDGTIYRN